ncbi:MAG: MurR/RpiR family transcriptional regulator, partial [Pseudomonadota bacterium]
MTDASQTISDRIHAKLDEMTRAERQLALSILENYPASGLGPLTTLAKGANVSVPTVARMVQKLGFNGYPEFQAILREEVGAIGKGPIAKHETWAGAAPSGHILNRFTDAVIDNIRSTLAHIDPAAVDRASAHVAHRTRQNNKGGGPNTQTRAEKHIHHKQV